MLQETENKDEIKNIELAIKNLENQKLEDKKLQLKNTKIIGSTFGKKKSNLKSRMFISNIRKFQIFNNNNGRK
jgi:hypothetical protein